MHYDSLALIGLSTFLWFAIAAVWGWAIVEMLTERDPQWEPWERWTFFGLTVFVTVALGIIAHWLYGRAWDGI